MSLTVDPDWWKTLFDEVYLATDARSVGDEELTRREAELVARLAELAPGQRVLDLCGGHGRHSRALTRRGLGACTVFDYSRPLLARGAALGAQSGIAWVQGDARELGFADASFDRVLVLGNSLGYQAGPADDRRILAEAFRVLASEGRVLLDLADGAAARACFTPTAWHEQGDLVVCRQRELLPASIRAREMVVDKNIGLVRDRTYEIRLYAPDEVRALLRSAGFGGIEVLTDFSLHGEKGDYGFMNHRLMATGRKL
jgi:D-alanine-D-alanine ligase